MFGPFREAKADDRDICVLDGSAEEMVPCASAPKWGSSTIIASGVGVGGVRLNKGVASWTPLDKHGYCYFVDNNFPKDVFIPFRSKLEFESFIDNIKRPEEIVLTACARPYKGPLFVFGPSSALAAKGDTNGDRNIGTATTTYQVDLPYWRAGQEWPPKAYRNKVTACSACTHKFSHSCYEEYPVPKCLKDCSVTDKKGRTTVYCCDWGSTCEKRWTDWNETFGFLAKGKAGKTGAASWSVGAAPSSRIAGTVRPDVSCTERCTSDGQDCSCPNYKPDPKIDGVCSALNGDTLKAKPALADLCVAGTPKSLSGTGPWTWVCVGSGGGSSVSCDAQTSVVDGVCGSAANQTLLAAPSGTSLCAKGTGGTVTTTADGKYWSWTCTGENGGKAASCQATVKPVPINGECGSAKGQTLSSSPTDPALCKKGTSGSVTTSSGTYNWSCNGQNGGSNVACSALRVTVVTGKCGSAKGQTYTTKPASGLCSAGTASGVSINAADFSWACAGSGGGTNATCLAKRKVDGKCVPFGCSEGLSTGIRHSNLNIYYKTVLPFVSYLTCVGYNGGANATCCMIAGDFYGDGESFQTAHRYSQGHGENGTQYCEVVKYTCGSGGVTGTYIRDCVSGQDE